MINPFVSVSVQPAYGQHTAVVMWNLLPGYNAGNIFVYRSRTGNRDWELATEDPVVGGSYSDTGVRGTDQFEPLFYRLLLEHEGQEFDSPVIAPYGRLNRDEYKAVRRIMNVEFDIMTRGRQGLQMWLFTPLRTGQVAASVDAQTGQQFHVETEESYGEKFVGGFSAPIMTWVKLSGVGPLQRQDTPDGENTEVKQDTQARVLSYPTVRRGDLLVHPETDTRYSIDDTVHTYLFRGIIPVAHDVKLIRLPRRDPRYRLPVPAIP